MLDNVLAEALLPNALEIVSSKTFPISLDKDECKEAIFFLVYSITHESTHSGCVRYVFPTELEECNEKHLLETGIRVIDGPKIDACLVFSGDINSKHVYLLKVEGLFMCGSCRNKYCKHCALNENSKEETENICMTCRRYDSTEHKSRRMSEKDMRCEL